jgi:hypothetical protein
MDQSSHNKIGHPELYSYPFIHASFFHHGKAKFHYLKTTKLLSMILIVLRNKFACVKLYGFSQNTPNIIAREPNNITKHTREVKRPSGTCCRETRVVKVCEHSPLGQPFLSQP